MTAPGPASAPTSQPAVSDPASAPVPGSAPGSAPAGRGFRALLEKRHDPLVSVALTLPVFLLYHLGILLVTPRAGVDLVSTLVFSLLETSTSAYVIATLALALGLSSWVWIAQKRGAASPASIGPVLLESAVFALGLLVTVGWATHRLSRTLDVAAAQGLSVLDKVVLAAGAGFHEELLFRALLVAGGAVFVERMFRMQRGLSLALCVIFSSLAFSLAHNFGAFGEPFVLEAFTYRVLAGVFLSGIFLWRGFAVVVYSHTLYSLLVFFVYA